MDEFNADWFSDFDSADGGDGSANWDFEDEAPSMNEDTGNSSGLSTMDNWLFDEDQSLPGTPVSTATGGDDLGNFFNQIGKGIPDIFGKVLNAAGNSATHAVESKGSSWIDSLLGGTKSPTTTYKGPAGSNSVTGVQIAGYTLGIGTLAILAGVGIWLIVASRK